MISYNNEQVELKETKFIIKVIWVPREGKGKKLINLATATATKRSIIRIQNEDNLYLLRAVVVGLASKLKLFEKSFEKVRVTEH